MVASSAIVLKIVLPAAAQDCPQLLGRWPYGTARAVAVSGSLAFVASGTALLVLDVSAPSSPQLLGSVTLPELVEGIAAAGSHVYVANDMSGLRVIDVSNPAAPAERGLVETSGFAYGVAVNGGYAFVADESAGLTVVGVRVPTAPSVVATLAASGNAYGVTISGNHAYLAGTGGLHIIDISAPAAPHEVGSLAGHAEAVDVAGSLAYVAGSWRGVVVVDVSDPSRPVELGLYDTPGNSDDLTLAAGMVVVADDDAGVAIFDDCEGWTSEIPVSYIPAAAVAAGAQGAFFQTDLEINNTGTEGTQLTVQWLPRGKDNSDPAGSNVIELGPGESERFENVLTELFGLEPDAVGALRLVASTGSVIGMSRTYNSPDGKATGTFGQGLPAIRSTEMISGTEPRRIIFLSEDPDSRANVGCVNGSDEAAVVSLQLFNAEGVALETKSMSLPPYSNDQITRVFRTHAPISGGTTATAACPSPACPQCACGTPGALATPVASPNLFARTPRPMLQSNRRPRRRR